MPRRDALNEKKRERLMQEHERLQKLMLQARSTVRRSSLQPRTTDAVNEEETNADVPELEQRETNTYDVANSSPSPTPKNSTNEARRTLTESDLFPEQQTGQDKKIIHVVLPQVESRAEAATQKRSERFIEPEEASVEEPQIATNNADDYFLPEEPRKKSSALKYILILAGALLLGFGAYWFYFQSGPKQKPVVTEKKQPVRNVTQTRQLTPIDTTSSRDTASTQTNTKTEITSRRKEETQSTKAQTATSNTNPASKVGRYKVISKAYFHNEPDESTRRSAFIVHWNNAVLTPTEEKSGFVYVVFTNHLGQTSKGWLRKKDLRRIQ